MQAPTVFQFPVGVPCPRQAPPLSPELYKLVFDQPSMFKNADGHLKFGPSPEVEGLEFLGCRILEAIVGVLVASELREARGSVLTGVNNAVISHVQLSYYAGILGLADTVRLGKGFLPFRHKERTRSAILKVYVGALYRQLGWPETLEFFSPLFIPAVKHYDAQLREEQQAKAAAAAVVAVSSGTVNPPAKQLPKRKLGDEDVDPEAQGKKKKKRSRKNKRGGENQPNTAVGSSSPSAVASVAQPAQVTPGPPLRTPATAAAPAPKTNPTKPCEKVGEKKPSLERKKDNRRGRGGEKAGDKTGAGVKKVAQSLPSKKGGKAGKASSKPANPQPKIRDEAARQSTEVRKKFEGQLVEDGAALFAALGVTQKQQGQEPQLKQEAREKAQEQAQLVQEEAKASNEEEKRESKKPSDEMEVDDIVDYEVDSIVVDEKEDGISYTIEEQCVGGAMDTKEDEADAQAEDEGLSGRLENSLWAPKEGEEQPTLKVDTGNRDQVTEGRKPTPKLHHDQQPKQVQPRKEQPKGAKCGKSSKEHNRNGFQHRIQKRKGGA
ncbi:hypothetical protein H072_4657 [Dactylellina haptotyla CBS 200.50]|uniref:RNase III domain-containing protein n=1 Tax=Dactylellina haptotyla (strain CBS 200.50) TaxID=1284197 RepID=S8BPQ9_DACHA|nr:hypothetical protein H072_4657 [Dactylellina haptotyla CBS 200.50]